MLKIAYQDEELCADLSETELIQILDKIYSGSDKVKNKLSEVIELISQKLQNQ